MAKPWLNFGCVSAAGSAAGSTANSSSVASAASAGASNALLPNSTSVVMASTSASNVSNLACGLKKAQMSSRISAS